MALKTLIMKQHYIYASLHLSLHLMLKTRPLFTGAKSYLGDRVLGEAQENSFIALPDKGGCSRLVL